MSTAELKRKIEYGNGSKIKQRSSVKASDAKRDGRRRTNMEKKYTEFKTSEAKEIKTITQCVLLEREKRQGIRFAYITPVEVSF
jgi:hypothetical protein